MNHKIRFEAPAGERYLRRYFFGITNFSGLWWSKKHRRWITKDSEEYKNHDGLSTHCEDVRTFKAFKRHLRKHPELAGVEVIFVNRMEGCSIIAEPI